MHLKHRVSRLYMHTCLVSVFFKSEARFRIQLEAFDFTGRGLGKEATGAKPAETINFPSACKVYLKPAVSDSKTKFTRSSFVFFHATFQGPFVKFLAREHFRVKS